MLPTPSLNTSENSAARAKAGSMVRIGSIKPDPLSDVLPRLVFAIRDKVNPKMFSELEEMSFIVVIENEGVIIPPQLPTTED